MSSTEELIKALRCCGNTDTKKPDCEHCPLLSTRMCVKVMLEGAASALEAADKELAELREANRWIPVSERLPEKEGDYLGYYSLEKVTFKARYRHGEWSALSNESYSALWRVTHWKPMPEPPQKGE